MKDAAFESVMGSKNMPHMADPGYDRWLFDATILALEAAGVRMVPVEATGDMLMAGIESDAIQHPWQALDVYRRMLAASPYAQKETK